MKVSTYINTANMIVINKKLKMIVIIKINKICYNQFRSNAPALKFEV